MNRAGRQGSVATALGIATAVATVIWLVLAIENHRTWNYLLAQNEAAAAVFGLSIGVAGALVVMRTPHALGWLLVGSGFVLTASNVFAEYAARIPAPPAAPFASAMANSLWLPPFAACAALITPLFPDGKPPSRRWRPLVIAGATASAAVTIAVTFGDPVGMNSTLPAYRNPLELHSLHPATAVLFALGMGVAVACGLTGVVLLAVRMARTAGPVRRQIGWLFAAFVVLFAAQLSPTGPLVWLVVSAFFPVALSVAMFRHGLFDGDRLLNRTLVYGALTLVVAGVFGLTVGLASRWLGGSGTGAIVAAVVIALGMAPARDVVQRSVDRLLYGQRRDPYSAIAGLGRRLANAIAPDAVLPIVVATIADGLRCPYVAVTLGGEPIPAAATGAPVERTVELPLVHAGTDVGRLTVGLRPSQRHLDPADERLLNDFARQAGAAAHGVRLTHDLRRSRDALAVAREEERHRIRRDLHDGLGPTLAGVALGLGAARRAVKNAAPETADLLGDLESEIRDSLDDVKLLVADLRPTTLEQVGLLRALRQYADAVSVRTAGSLQVSVATPVPLPPLEPEVEVAAYRIALEALTNVARHSAAHHAVVTAATTDSELLVTISDDGVGMPRDLPAGGLGVRSMHERAAELGGECVIAPANTRARWSARPGTSVRARLPLARGAAGPAGPAGGAS